MNIFQNSIMKQMFGTGRGSSSAGLDNYLMGLTQYNPITAGVNNYFRYLNKSRTELPKQNWAV